MKLSQNVKHLIAILTFINLLAGIVGLVWFFSAILPVLITADEQTISGLILMSAPFMIAGIVLYGLLSTGLLVFYLIHAAMNAGLSTAMKVVWILIILFLKPIAEVVYLFVEIYGGSSAAPQVSPEYSRTEA